MNLETMGLGDTGFAVGLSIAETGWIKPFFCADPFPWRGLDPGWRRGAQECSVPLKAALGNGSLGVTSVGDRLGRNADFFHAGFIEASE